MRVISKPSGRADRRRFIEAIATAANNDLFLAPSHHESPWHKLHANGQVHPRSWAHQCRGCLEAVIDFALGNFEFGIMHMDTLARRGARRSLR